jgi:hypothetical protein
MSLDRADAAPESSEAPPLGWPPAGWYFGPPDWAKWRLAFTYDPPRINFTARDAHVWADAAVRLYEYCREEGLRVTQPGKHRKTALHNVQLLVAELCRRQVLPPPPRVTRDEDCDIDLELAGLTALRDWLQRAAYLEAQGASAAPVTPTKAPFEIDLSDRNRPHLVRREGDIISKEIIGLEAAIFLQAILESDGLWISSADALAELRDGNLKLSRIKKQIPADILALLDFKRAKGARLKVELWRNNG